MPAPDSCELVRIADVLDERGRPLSLRPPELVGGQPPQQLGLPLRGTLGDPLGDPLGDSLLVALAEPLGLPQRWDDDLPLVRSFVEIAPPFE